MTANATVTVPEGSEDAYNASPQWDEMVEGDVEGVESIFTNPEMEMDVYDLNGVLIRSKIKAEDINSLPAGLYILKNADLTTKVIIR